MCEKKQILIISDSDLDGVGAVVVAKKVFPSIKYIFPERDMLNSSVEEAISSGEYGCIFMTDCAVSNEHTEHMIEEYVAEGNKFILLDHHKSALNLNKYKWSHVKVETNGFKHCGTELIYSFLKDLGLNLDELDEFVELVRSYDTWDWANTNNPIPERLNTLYWNYGDKDIFIQTMIDRVSSNAVLINDKDNAIIDTIKRIDEKYIEARKTMFVSKFYGEYKVAVLFTDRCVSQLGNIICKENKDIDFCCLVDLNRCKVSMRCVKDTVDVEEIARKFNGGGHSKAAGFVLTQDIKNKIMDLIL